MGHVAEAAALHVLVGNFNHQLGTQRLPGQVFALAPAALAAGHATPSFTSLESCSAQPLQGMIGERVPSIRQKKFCELAALLGGKARTNTHVLQCSPIIEEAEQQ